MGGVFGVVGCRLVMATRWGRGLGTGVGVSVLVVSVFAYFFIINRTPVFLINVTGNYFAWRFKKGNSERFEKDSPFHEFVVNICVALI